MNKFQLGIAAIAGATVIVVAGLVTHPWEHAAAAVPAPVKTVIIHHNKTVIQPAAPAPQAPAAVPAIPDSGLSYKGQGPLGGVYANSATSAPFAVAVADAYAGNGDSDYENVYSPVTGETYGMSYANVGNRTIDATGGNGVLVQFAY